MQGFLHWCARSPLARAPAAGTHHTTPVRSPGSGADLSHLAIDCPPPLSHRVAVTQRRTMLFTHSHCSHVTSRCLRAPCCPLGCLCLWSLVAVCALQCAVRWVCSFVPQAQLAALRQETAKTFWDTGGRRMHRALAQRSTCAVSLPLTTILRTPPPHTHKCKPAPRPHPLLAPPCPAAMALRMVHVHSAPCMLGSGGVDNGAIRVAVPAAPLPGSRPPLSLM